MIRKSLKSKGQWISVLAIVISLFSVSLISYQVLILGIEQSIRIRPWIGSTEVEFLSIITEQGRLDRATSAAIISGQIAYDEGKWGEKLKYEFAIILHNFGDTPAFLFATNVRGRSGAEPELADASIATSPTTILMPRSDRAIHADIDANLIDIAWGGGQEYFLSIRVDYRFSPISPIGVGKGFYEVLVKFDDNSEISRRVEEPGFIIRELAG